MDCKLILIVDDDLDLRQNLQLFFESEGYSVILAANGQVALDILEDNATLKISLILLDIMMPVMDGPAFLLEMKKKYPEIYAYIPIFIISAGAAPQLETETTGFLKKPFDLDALSKVANKYCYQVSP